MITDWNLMTEAGKIWNGQVIVVLLQGGQVPHPWFFGKECGKVNQYHLVTMSPICCYTTRLSVQISMFQKTVPWNMRIYRISSSRTTSWRCVDSRSYHSFKKICPTQTKKSNTRNIRSWDCCSAPTPGTFMAKSESFLSFRVKPSSPIVVGFEPLANPMMPWVQGDHLPEFWLHKYFALGMKIVCQCPTIQCYIDHFRYQRPTMFSPFTIDMYIAFIAIFKLFWKAKRIQKVNTYLCHVSYMAAKASPISLHPPSVHLGKSSIFEH